MRKTSLFVLALALLAVAIAPAASPVLTVFLLITALVIAIGSGLREEC
jgi:hypothetical protein